MIESLGTHDSFGGTQSFHRHRSIAIGAPMKFGVYRPSTCIGNQSPAPIYLAGLTCTKETSRSRRGRNAQQPSTA